MRTLFYRMNIKLKNFFFIALLFSLTNGEAKEGMWLPNTLEQLVFSDMQQMGLKLSAEDIYSINHSSLKDAIVLFGGGCTGEIVSDKGLLLTNYHCGYSAIQSHSSLNADYLVKGFWAANNGEELQNAGLTATIVVKIEDVTKDALKGITLSTTEYQRNKMVAANCEAIEKNAVKGTHYKAKVKPFSYGNEYYLIITEVFTDVRLVGAPPSSIGKFGGDTDNWMWPRHTGDFSVFRIYAGKDNLPAAYSKENKPYVPKKSLSISLKGVKKNDFTFVYGFPGTTEENLTSQGIQLTQNVENPVAIELRRKRLDIIDKYMNSSEFIRIQYSAKYAGISNYWKKMIGENNGLRRLDAINKKKETEKNFTKWYSANPDDFTKYSDLFPAFEKIYQRYTPLSEAYTYFYEGGVGIEAVKLSYSYTNLIDASKQKDNTDEDITQAAEKLLASARGFHKNYNLSLDKEICGELLQQYYLKCKPQFQPAAFADIQKKYNGDVKKFVEALYSKTIFSDSTKLIGLLKGYKRGDYKKIESDPMYQLSLSIYSNFNTNILPAKQQCEGQLDSLYRIYVRGLRQMQQDKKWWPDANLTLRVAYGKVEDYFPKDGVSYNYFTTLDGIMEKEDPAVYDYVVDKKLKELNRKKSFSRYADADGSMHVAFIASNQTTGGNSGSPVLNANGELVGINFDRNWEGTMSDLMYDPTQCRNIILDIRYCLFVIDKFAGAANLVKEMKIVE